MSHVWTPLQNFFVLGEISMNSGFTLRTTVTFPSFKLSADENQKTGLSLTNAGSDIRIASGRNDHAAFSLLVSANEAFALQTDTAPWFSQNVALPTVRVACDTSFPFPLTISHTAMHQINDGTYRADAVLHETVREIAADTVAQLYCTVHIPSDTPPGSYSGTLHFFCNRAFDDEFRMEDCDIFFTIQVYAFCFPDNRKNGFHLDLWQHSSNIARKYEVPLWSNAHFAILENYIRSLGALGAKSVTIVASEIPWNGQYCSGMPEGTNLYEYSIIGVTKKKDGTFLYDYTAMQRYIDLCAKYGIDEAISIFGLVGVWNTGNRFHGKIVRDYPDLMRIRYLDEASGTYRYMKNGCEVDDYIHSLEQYFVHTNQIAKVRLSADEPHDLEPFKESLERMHKAAPQFRCKTACDQIEFVDAFSALTDDFIYDIIAASNRCEEMQAAIKAHPDKRFLHYVCCEPDYPNMFLKSELVESYFLCIFASYHHFSGFLRWDYTVWNDHPRDNAIVGTWNAGDSYFVYPSADGTPLLSLRWYALRRGIQFFVLMEEVKKRGMQDVYDHALSLVLREKDPTKLIAHEEKTDSISCDMADYEAVWEYLLSKL